jgi:chaperonin GroES
MSAKLIAADDDANWGISAAPLNTSGLRPLTRRVLVLRDAVEEKTKGGLFLPDSVVDKEKWATVDGTLIAAGPLAWAEDRHDSKLYGVPHGIPEPGARVKVGKYTGDNHEGADGKLYTIMNDHDIIASMEAEK